MGPYSGGASVHKKPINGSAFRWGVGPSLAGDSKGILHLAARENEAAVDDALRTLLDKDRPISLETVERIVRCEGRIPWPAPSVVAEVDLAAYDALLRSKEVMPCYQAN